MSSKKAKPLLYDKQIIGRVQECLLESTDNKLADFGAVVRLLHTKYPEYRRRRQGPFRQLAKQAYRIVCDNLNEGLSADSRTESETDTENEDNTTAVTPKANLLNNMFQSLYKANMPPQSKANEYANKSVTIDISSSGEDEDDSRSSMPAANYQRQPNSSPEWTAHSDTGDVPSKADIVTLKAKPTMKRKSAQPAAAKQPLPKRMFKKKIVAETPRINFENVAGIDHILKRLCVELFNVVAPEYYLILGVKPPNGMLITGPTGCGKTTLAEAIAGQIEFQFINVPATELIAGVSGESEERIREVFEQAILFAPCVLFIDDIDAIGGNRASAQKEMQARMTSQLISCLDTLKTKSRDARILVIGATSRPDVLDSALRRPGRFDQEIALPVPDRRGRLEIFEKFCRELPMDKDFNLDKLAELTPGYVAADIAALIARAGTIAVKKIWSAKLYELENANTNPTIDLDDEIVLVNGDQGNEGQKQATAENDLEAEIDKTNDGEKTSTPANDLEDDTKPHEVEKAPEQQQIDESNKIHDQPENEGEEAQTQSPESTVNSIAAQPQLKQSPSSSSPPKDWEPTLTQLLNWLSNPPSWDKFHTVVFSMNDFMEALKVFQPSAKREGFITVPDVSWRDIGSLHDVRDQLKLAILAPVQYPKIVERLGLNTPAGVLLCGPPGCGKTLIAKAVANEAGTNFISVKGPEMMNMYVGESERAVRECFQRARNSAPCVIFFDEFDSLCPKRSGSGEAGGSGVRIVNQLLTEMDGLEERKGVYVLAATNRPDIIDPAVLRPGRLDNIVYIGMPNEAARCEILNAITKNGTSPVMSADVKFEEIAKMTEGYTGADLSGLIKQASQLALRHALENDVPDEELCVKSEHIAEAVKLTRPSVSEQERKVYEELRLKYGVRG